MPRKELFVPSYEHKALYFLFALSLLIAISGHGADHKSAPAIIPNKLNVLHLHLTDDQGWRLEIKN